MYWLNILWRKRSERIHDASRSSGKFNTADHAYTTNTKLKLDSLVLAKPQLLRLWKVWNFDYTMPPGTRSKLTPEDKCNSGVWKLIMTLCKTVAHWYIPYCPSLLSRILRYCLCKWIFILVWSIYTVYTGQSYMRQSSAASGPVWVLLYMKCS